MAPQRRANRGRRDAYAKPLEFASDALVAPPRVLPGQADDQVLDLLVQRRPAGLAVRVGPGDGDQPSVPAQQCVGLHEQARPMGSGQRPADRGEQGPISRLQPGAWGLATEDGELVAQDQDLQVLGGVAANKQHEHLNRAAVGSARTAATAEHRCPAGPGADIGACVLLRRLSIWLMPFSACSDQAPTMRLPPSRDAGRRRREHRRRSRLARRCWRPRECFG
jgi:hypothetical protein